jgi:hypothetical protein
LRAGKRLLKALARENEIVAEQGPAVIPQIEYKNLENPSDHFLSQVEKRGVAVVRGVIPDDEARGYKTEVEEYVTANPWTKGK